MSEQRDDEINGCMPHCPAELIKWLKRRSGINITLIAGGPLAERIRNDMQMEAWQGKGPKDTDDK